MLSETTAAIVDEQVVPHVAEPASPRELSDLLADLDREGLHAVIVGGGSRLSFGNLGGPFDVAISTSKLNRVLHYEPDDLTLAVEPGCTIGNIADLLEASGQAISLDDPHPSRSTIGGAYATGMSGPRRLGGGSLKDWTVGIEVIDPRGIVAKAGGMVVKNVTGYDMMHLHYGALGAFGVVSRLNLKVFPSPGPPRSIILAFRSPVDAYASGIALLRSQLAPSSLLVSNQPAWTLSIRIDGPMAAIDRLAQRVVDVARAAAPLEEIQLSESSSLALKPFVKATDLLNESSVARISVPASRQVATIDRIGAGFAHLVCADLGSGLVYITGDGEGEWIDLVRSLDSRPVFLTLPAHMKTGLDVFGGMDDAGAGVVRRLKVAFDPDGRFNRGRFVLGL